VTFDLDRFLHAQESGGTYVHAMEELRAGAKRSHWIWFVFPQLAGLGSSPMAEMYGLQGVEEAVAYLKQPVLRERLLSAMNAVRASFDFAQDKQVPLRQLMGSQIDALKLVSSMTLFREIGDEEIAAGAEEILRRAAGEGFEPCAFTLRACSRQ
jgi:uncharacterized protein (DUF1810 family)